MKSYLLLKILEYNTLGLPVYSEGNNVSSFLDNPLFSWMGLWSALLAGLVILLTFGCAFLIDKKHKWFEEVANGNLTYAFCLVWLFGFIVYDIGLYTGEPWSLLGNMPMAIIHSFGIFIFSVGTIHEPFRNNAWFMAIFSLVHFFAALVSLVFVLKYFGYNLIATFRRRFTVAAKEDTFIFWGLNDATYYLAKDINNKIGKDAKHNIIVVRTNKDVEKNDNAPNGMNRLFNFLSLKNDELNRLKELDCITANTYVNLSALEFSKEEQPSLDILERMVRLKSICRIIRKKTTKSLHLFFLSDNEIANIQAIANLKKDKVIQEFANRGKVKFYCHARYNSLHRVIEDEIVHKNVEVKVVDSSHICIELMKNNLESHPIKYVDVEKDATVSSPFNSLVIGFGEVGMDTVRFLYEFGAFVKSGDKIVKRSEFHCHVVDEKMDNLAGVFIASAPSIATSRNWKNEDADKLINLYNMDCRSVEFYDKLEKWIESLNYIVIATGDDEINISLAVRIFRLAIRYRKDNLRKFHIFVRIQHDDNEYFLRIAEHYNRLWAAELKDGVDENNKKKLHQRSITLKDPVRIPITLFGSLESVYKYDNIVDISLIEMAKQFKKKYDLSINEMRRLAGEEPYAIEKWEDEQNNAMQLTGEYDGYSPTLGGIMRLRRVQYQNLINCLHKATKMELAKLALGEGKLKEVLRRGLVRRNGSLKYSWRDNSNEPIENVQSILDVLAQTEHLRWNASHEVLGYRKHEDEEYIDESRQLHGCLREWERLKDITKSYDYNIVDVSLGIIDINDRSKGC